MNQTARGRLVILSGPSGVGKSTICAQVVAKTDVFLNVSTTTRPKADTEAEGKDYWFISREEFEAKVKAGDFLEHAEVFGNLYGTDESKVEEKLESGQTVILEIDVQGAQKVKKMHPEATMIFILPPSHSELAKRMKDRGRGEDDATAKRRLDQAGQEIAAAWQFYDYMVINDVLENAVQEVVQIIETNTGEQK